MKKGQKVIWKDPVSGEQRVGILQSRDIVVAEAKAYPDGLPGKFKDVNEISWTVAEWKTGKPFNIGEKYLKIK